MQYLISDSIVTLVLINKFFKCTCCNYQMTKLILNFCAINFLKLRIFTWDSFKIKWEAPTKIYIVSHEQNFSKGKLVLDCGDISLLKVDKQIIKLWKYFYIYVGFELPTCCVEPCPRASDGQNYALDIT